MKKMHGIHFVSYKQPLENDHDDDNNGNGDDNMMPGTTTTNTSSAKEFEKLQNSLPDIEQQLQTGYS